MKIAVCISGPLRTFDPMYMMDIYKDADFFIQTDKYDDRINKIKPKLYSVSNFNFEKHPFRKMNISDNSHIDFNENKEIKLKNRNWVCNPHNALSMFYNIMSCNNLKSIYEQNNNIKYDVVIRTRPDLFFIDKLNLDSFNTSVVNTFTSPHSDHYKYINDHFALSNSENMDIFSSTYLYIPKYYYIDKVNFVPEFLLGQHLSEFNIEYTEHSLSYLIKREDESKNVYMNK